MKYQLYKVDEMGKRRYLYQKTNNTISFRLHKASSFNYEVAQSMKNKYAQHNLIVCDENSKEFKEELQSKADVWKSKIQDNDILSYEKGNAIVVATELLYSDETLEKIINATTENEISRILYNARKSA